MNTDMFPDILFESPQLPSPKICFGCGSEYAVSGLFSQQQIKLIVPLCKSCSGEWNFHGYQMLKKIKPKDLLWKLVKFKGKHPLAAPSVAEVYRDLRDFNEWTQAAIRFKAKLKRQE